jgi:TPR repeat protein
MAATQAVSTPKSSAAFESAKLKLSQHDFDAVDLPQNCESPLWKEIRAECGLTLAEISALQNYVTAQTQTTSSGIALGSLAVVLTTQELTGSHLPANVTPAEVTPAEASVQDLRNWLSDVPDVTVLQALLGPGDCFFDLLPEFEPTSLTTITRSVIEDVVREHREFIIDIALKPDVDLEYLLAIRLFTLQEPIPFFSYINDILNSEERTGLGFIAPFVRILIQALYALEGAGYGAETQGYRGLKIAENSVLSHQYDNYKTELPVGGLVRFKGFTSVSVLDTASEVFGDSMFYQFLKIRGVNISSLSKYPDESELLVMPPVVFRISAVYKLSGKLIVTLSQERQVDDFYLIRAAGPRQANDRPSHIEGNASRHRAEEQSVTTAVVGLSISSCSIMFESTKADADCPPTLYETDSGEMAYQMGCKLAAGAEGETDYIEIVSCFFRAANLGHAEAQNSLGDCFYNGQGVALNYNSAFEWYQRSADLGNKEAMGNLGTCYAEGEGTEENMVAAEKWTRMSAERGDTEAPITLARWYFLGHLPTDDPSDVLRWYRIAANYGDVVGQCALGIHYAFDKQGKWDMTEAFRLVQLSAEQGYSCGQYNLGKFYSEGIGVSKNLKESVKWLRRAAEQGHCHAEYDLGICYANGDGVTRDYKVAFHWALLAAEQGLAIAQHAVATFYEKGKGCEKDTVEAMKWYHCAAIQGDVEAQFALAHRYSGGCGVAKNVDEGILWCKKAADQNHLPAESLLGTLYSRDFQDDANAVKWFLVAAEKNDAHSQWKLGVHYMKGLGVAKDEKEAMKWLRRAVKQDNLDAVETLAQCYAIGEGVPQSWKEAVKLYRASGDRGRVKSIKSLADCYLNGHGVVKSKSEAIKYYHIAAARGDPDSQYQLFVEYFESGNIDESIPFLQAASAGGNLDGQCMLGLLLIEGWHVNHDQETGVRLLRSVVDKGFAEGQVNFGMLHLSGTGVGRDPVEAVRLFRLAANQQHGKAQYELGKCYAIGDGVPQDCEEAVKWYQLAAAGDRYSKEAATKLGYCYLSGQGVEKNRKQAIKWFRMAAEKGDDEAARILKSLR